MLRVLCWYIHIHIYISGRADTAAALRVVGLPLFKESAAAGLLAETKLAAASRSRPLPPPPSIDHTPSKALGPSLLAQVPATYYD